MANFDILCFLEYYSDRSAVTDTRSPTKQWQNFYQEPQQLGSADSGATGDYRFLAFDVEGFGSTEASSINDLSVSAAATAEIVDVTEQAIGADNLIIASLYIQTVGSNSFDPSSAQLISRYIGSIEGASLSDEEVSWTINPAITKVDAQVPPRKVAAGMTQKILGV